MKVLGNSNEDDVFDYSFDAWDRVTKNAHALDKKINYHTTISLYGLDYDIHVKGHYKRSTFSSPAQFPEAEIKDINIYDTEEFTDEFCFSVFEDEYFNMLDNALELQFPDEFNFVFKGVQFHINNPSNKSEDTEILTAECIEKEDLLKSLPQSWLQEVADLAVEESLKEEALN